MSTTNTRAREIVANAYRCLAERGFEGLRTRDVAAATGINIATLHYYFRSKEDLVAAVVVHAQETFQRETAPPSEDGEPAERLRHHLHAVFEVLTTDPALGAALAEIGVRARRDGAVAAAVTSAEAQWRDALVAMLAPLPEPRARAVAATLITTIKGACLPAEPAELRLVRDGLLGYVNAALAAGGGGGGQ